MRRRGNEYSRLIAALKVALPLAALALLSTLFMVSRSINPEDALPYAEVDIADLVRDPRLTAPSFSGLTREGDEVLFTAEIAYPGGEGARGARAEKTLLRIVSPAGVETQVIAQEARIDPVAERLYLAGGVQFDSQTGYALTSETLEASLDHTRLESTAPTQALAPGTQLHADSMVLTRPAGSGSELLVFKGNVKLLYDPKAATAGAPTSSETQP